MSVANRVFKLLVCLGMIAGCAPSPGSSSNDGRLGTMTINLVGQAPSGSVYRLRDATIDVEGAGETQVWNTEDDLTRTSLSADVAPGDYAALVHDGWRLERLEGSTAIPVTSSLASSNPVQFAVVPGQRTSVPLRFIVDADAVDLTQGYDITITIEEAPRRVVLSQLGFQAIPNGIRTFSQTASGDVSPLQQITGPRTELSFPSAITVVGGQLLVCDQDRNDLAFYAATADGDVAPVRRIAGPSTELSFPVNAVVSNGEIYTIQGDGRVLVFPAAASGDVAPSRSFDARGPGFMAVDRGEVYVRTTTDDGASLPRIRVFPATATGTPQPSRTIIGMIGDSGACPGTLIVNNQEIFVTDRCGAIYVFPANADGLTPPLRTIRGGNTQLNMPWQIALFHNELYLVDQAADQVAVFPVQGSGDIAPTRVIHGPNTGIAQPFGVAVF
jgi:hypothetical protein